MHHILIIEDESIIADVLSEFLIANDMQTTILYDGEFAVDNIKNNAYDLIILDLMLPGKPGLDICKEVRQFSDLPIIMTTSRIEEIDRLIGLELGADDYICKPYSAREVVARIKTVLRRTVKDPKQSAVQKGNLTLDVERMIMTLDGQNTDLTISEFKLLQTFLNHPGKAFTRDTLQTCLYEDQKANTHQVITNRTIDTHIKNLRKKLEYLNPNKNFIHSVYSVGYKFEA